MLGIMEVGIRERGEQRIALSVGPLQVADEGCAHAPEDARVPLRTHVPFTNFMPVSGKYGIKALTRILNSHI